MKDFAQNYLEIAVTTDGNGYRWNYWDGGWYPIPETWGREPMSAALAGIQAIKAGLLASEGKTKVVDIGFGKGGRL